MVIFVLSNFEIGQPSLAFLAASWNLASSAPGTLAFTSRWTAVTAKPLPAFSKGDCSRRLHALWFKPDFRELRGNRHRETARVRGTDELLRVRALFVLEARTEEIRGVGGHAALGGNCAAAIFKAALPDSGSFSVHILKSLLSGRSRVRTGVLRSKTNGLGTDIAIGGGIVRRAWRKAFPARPHAVSCRVWQTAQCARTEARTAQGTTAPAKRHHP
jgi:hypothetical protein